LGSGGAFFGGIFSSFVSVGGELLLGFEDVQPLAHPSKLSRSATVSHSLTLVTIHASFP
jgi:hypothetical protein